jgi:hypothetical protein
MDYVTFFWLYLAPELFNCSIVVTDPLVYNTTPFKLNG